MEKRFSAGNTFTEKEIAFLRQLFATMARGGDVTILCRSQEYASIFRKVQTMTSTIERKRHEQVLDKEAN